MRKLLCFTLMVLGFMVTAAPPSQAGTYYVRDCFYDFDQMTYLNSNISWSTENPSNSTMQIYPCGGYALYLDDHKIWIPSGTYAHNSVAKVVWEAPEGAGISGVTGWAVTFDQATGFESKMLLYDDSTNGVNVPRGSGGYVDYSLASGSRRYFAMQTKCTLSPCNNSFNNATVHLAEVVLKIDDYTPPATSAEGTLLAGGTVSGTRTLKATNIDLGIGMKRSIIVVNGQIVEDHNLSCSSPTATPPRIPGNVPGSPATTYTEMRPCHSYWDIYTRTLDTRNAPFVEGSNSVVSCGMDGTGGWGCVGPFTVNVDN
ncbi:MAG: hypothetical protein J0H98_09110 [Solirubrobacterales bacterium]|nr:hypothetical protein [Solirubrobacterales bacterium]